MTVERVGGIEMRGEIRPPLSVRDGTYCLIKCRPDNANYVHGSGWQSHCSCDTKHFAGPTRLH